MPYDFYWMCERVNPALCDLGFLEGGWTMELSNAAFLEHPGQKIRGESSFEWVHGGAFLAWSQGDGVVWLFGRDEDVSEYRVLYFDDRRVSRIYEMSFGGRVWRMWRASPSFHQRFEAHVGTDRRTIAASREKSSDGKTWEHDFDLFLTRSEP